MGRENDKISRGVGWDGLPRPQRGERCPRCHGGAGGRPCMLCAPELVPLASYVDQLRAARAWCYWVFPGWWSLRRSGSYIISIVIERELGHYPTVGIDGEPSPVGFEPMYVAPRSPDIDAAVVDIRIINRVRGLPDREMDRIVASSLGADFGRGERVL